mmetsp:Transcript_79618/g.213887  ORF Transcript_79618/g.213887 Transcript_79618/m.213887 type:complete len:584 (-) Transcript_79618:637-2388(-)
MPRSHDSGPTPRPASAPPTTHRAPALTPASRERRRAAARSGAYCLSVGARRRLLREERGHVRPRGAAVLVHEVGEHQQQRRPAAVRGSRRGRAQGLPQPAQGGDQLADCAVVRLRQQRPRLRRPLGVERLEQLHHDRPEHRPGVARLAQALRVARLLAAQHEQRLQAHDPEAEVVHAGEVLLLEARVGVRGDVLEPEGEGHPRRGCPVARVASQVRAAPLLAPSAGAYRQAEVYEGEAGSRPRGAWRELDQHIVRGHVPVERDRPQRGEDWRQLHEHLPRESAGLLRRPEPLLATGEVPVHQLGDVRRLVVFVADAVYPSIECTTGNVRHGQTHDATAARVGILRGGVGDIPGDVAVHAAPRGAQHLEQLRLERGVGEASGVRACDDLHRHVLAAGVLLSRSPHDAERPAADDVEETELATADRERLPVVRLRLRGLLLPGEGGERCSDRRGRDLMVALRRLRAQGHGTLRRVFRRRARQVLEGSRGEEATVLRCLQRVSVLQRRLAQGQARHRQRHFLRQGGQLAARLGPCRAPWKGWRSRDALIHTRQGHRPGGHLARRGLRRAGLLRQLVGRPGVRGIET